MNPGASFAIPRFAKAAIGKLVTIATTAGSVLLGMIEGESIGAIEKMGAEPMSAEVVASAFGSALSRDPVFALTTRRVFTASRVPNARLRRLRFRFDAHQRTKYCRERYRSNLYEGGRDVGVRTDRLELPGSLGPHELPYLKLER